MNSLWLVITALAAFSVAYRLYGALLATKVAMLDDRRITPAHRLRDDVDYHPTKRLVLFGVHFAAIAGPGPLIGPVLASQWGYLPGFTWIVIGACLAGGVHDFVCLVASVRQDGVSLPKIARTMLGPLSGVVTTGATMFIIIATLAGMAMVVVKTLGESPWGMFTILVTIPAALLTGLWMYKIRPGKITEASIIGVTIVLAGVFFGKPFAESWMGHYLQFDETTLKVLLPVYAAIASILPVWLLLSPRGYLSSYMKIGVIVVLAVGLFVAQPTLKMPATTPFISGGGPVVSGTVWPFVCIVIMCGALSGFHSLVASGTTPKMINRESDIRAVGYGGMLLEGFVALTALIAACALEPGDYFKINTDKAKYAQFVAQVETEHHWDIRPVDFDKLQEEAGEKDLAGRTAGAVTLAVGMAKIFAAIPGMKTLMAYWYHFVIMFEALFILTLLETGTRVARFVFQEAVSQFRPAPAPGHHASWGLNITMSIVVCSLWGYLLYTGNIERLWRVMGIANQLLATIALAVGTTYLLTYASRRIYALTTAIPFAFTVVTVFAAGVQSIQKWWLELGTAGITPAQAMSVKTVSLLAAVMLLLSAVITIDAVRRWVLILSRARSVAVELKPAADVGGH